MDRLIALVLLRSLADSAFNPARQAALQAITAEPQLVTANALHQGLGQTAKVLGPAIGGLLAATGIGHIVVRPSPRVVVIATGDELVDIGRPSQPGQVVDANSHALTAAAAEAGALPALLTFADLRGDLHMHTTETDGKDSIEAMARAAQPGEMAPLAQPGVPPAVEAADGGGDAA